MYSSKRLLTAIGEISDDKIEKAGYELGYLEATRSFPFARLSRMLGFAAVFVLLLGISISAYPIYIHWSRGMEQILPVTEEEREYAKDSGLTESVQNSYAAKTESALDAQYDRAESISSTVNGVTVSVEQTIIDSNTARIALRIEGLILPEKAYPDIGGWQLTFGGYQISNISGGFVENRDAADNLVFADTDGSLEFDFYASDTEEGFTFEGKEIFLIIDSLGMGDKGEYEPLVEGPWEICWTPSSSTELLCMQPNAAVGDTGMKLLSVEIAPVSVKVTLKLDKLWEGYKTLEPFDWQLAGVRLEDGTELINIFGPSYEGYADLENLILELDYTSHKIIHPEQVDALLFVGRSVQAKVSTEEDIIIVPIE